MIELIAAAIVFAGLGILAFIIHDGGNKGRTELRNNLSLLSESLKEQIKFQGEQEQGNLKLQLKLQQQNHEDLSGKVVDLAEQLRNLSNTMGEYVQLAGKQSTNGTADNDIKIDTNKNLQQIVKAIEMVSAKLNTLPAILAPAQASTPTPAETPAAAQASAPAPAQTPAAPQALAPPPSACEEQPPGPTAAPAGRVENTDAGNQPAGNQPVSGNPASVNQNPESNNSAVPASTPAPSVIMAQADVVELPGLNTPAAEQSFPQALEPVAEAPTPSSSTLADRATRLLSELASSLGVDVLPAVTEEQTQASISFKDIEAKLDQEAVQIIEAAEKVRGISEEQETPGFPATAQDPDSDNAFTMATVEQPFSEAFVADGDRLFDAGKFAEAEKHYRQALPTLEEVLGRDHLAVIDILHKLAVIAYERGKYNDAANALQQIFARRVAQLGMNHAETLDTLYNIGRVELRRGNFGEAENLLQQAFEQRSKALGDKHRATILAEFELALVDLYRGEVEEAYQKLLTVYRKQIDQLGLEHLDTAGTAAALVQVLIMKSNLAEALNYFKQAVNVRLKLLGDDHPLVGELLGLKGLIHLKTGSLLDAEAGIKRSLVIRQQSLGERHPETSQSLELRSEVLRVQGQPKEAKPFGMQALYIRKTSLGLEHLDTAASMRNLGCVLIDLKEFAEAEEMLNRSLQIVEKNFPAGHPSLADNYLWLGVLRAAQSRHKDAQAHYVRAMEMYRRFFGDVNLGVADTLEQLTNSLLELGQSEDAAKCLQAALSIRENLLGSASPLVARLVRMGAKMPAAV